MIFSMNRWFLLAAVLLIVLTTVAAYIFLGTPGDAQLASVPTHFSVNGKSFVITYVATTHVQRESGLMNRKVTNTTTMLFVFPSPGAYQFWMYDTNTSLDIIWVNVANDTGLVVGLVKGAQPCYDSFACSRYGPTSPANYVIEARAGFAATNGIDTGSVIQFG